MSRRAGPGGESEDEASAARAPMDPEELVMSKQEHGHFRAMGNELRTVVRAEAKDALVAAFLDLWLDETDKAEEQAARLGIPLARVYALRATVRRFADQLTEEKRRAYITKGARWRHAPHRKPIRSAPCARCWG
jgi:hypothetical protein